MEKSSIQVFIRTKPTEDDNIVFIDNYNDIYLKEAISKDSNFKDHSMKKFTFDKCFDVYATQEEIFDDIGEKILSNAFDGYNTCVFAYGQTGCFGYDTDIMKYDGTYEKVQNIKICDVLMGDDSTPRNVLQLFRGYENLYLIDMTHNIQNVESLNQNAKALIQHNDTLHQNYVVNESHIMVFKISIKDYIKFYKDISKYRFEVFEEIERFDFVKLSNEIKNYILEISIKDYMELPLEVKNSLKCYTNIIDFPYKKTDEPYYNGYYVGFCILNNMILPDIMDFIYNDKKTRLEFLAGIIDILASYNNIFYKLIIPSFYSKKCYKRTRFNKAIKKDFLYYFTFLCNSLGIISSNSFYKTSDKISDKISVIKLSGNLSIIPSRKFKHTKTSYDSTIIPNITKINYGKYYGFMLDGNHRFIGAGFNVLRNSGKSHTMMGDIKTPGLIPRICQELFLRQSSDINYKIEMSYLEIYSEDIKDLLNPSSAKLKIRQHPIYGPYVEGLSNLLVENIDAIIKFIDQGNKNRITAYTLMNAHSSRSHAILTLTLTQILTLEEDRTKEMTSKINLVDLAGSEKVESSGVTGINFKEAININKSLSTLGLVINRLASNEEPEQKSNISSITSNRNITTRNTTTKPQITSLTKPQITSTRNTTNKPQITSSTKPQITSRINTNRQNLNSTTRQTTVNNSSHPKSIANIINEKNITLEKRNIPNTLTKSTSNPYLTKKNIEMHTIKTQPIIPKLDLGTSVNKDNEITITKSTNSNRFNSLSRLSSNRQSVSRQSLTRQSLTRQSVTKKQDDEISINSISTNISNSSRITNNSVSSRITSNSRITTNINNKSNDRLDTNRFIKSIDDKRTSLSRQSLVKSTSRSSISEHIPFRDSVLTWLLKNSLAGNSKTYMIATISPCSINQAETLGTLRYAMNAKKIVTNVSVNEDTNDKIINALQSEIMILRQKLSERGSDNMTPSSDLLEIKEQLNQREILIKEINKTWEVKNEESKKFIITIQEEMKRELEAKQKQHELEIEKLKNTYNQQFTQQDEIKKNLQDEIAKTKSEYELKTEEFEKKKIYDTAISLQKYYDEKVEDLKKQYEEKIKLLSDISNNQEFIVTKSELAKTKNTVTQIITEKTLLLSQLNQMHIKVHSLEHEISILKSPEIKKEYDELEKLYIDLNKDYDSLEVLNKKLIDKYDSNKEKYKQQFETFIFSYNSNIKNIISLIENADIPNLEIAIDELYKTFAIIDVFI
jgi:hypothetical protein